MMWLILSCLAITALVLSQILSKRSRNKVSSNTKSLSGRSAIPEKGQGIHFEIDDDFITIKKPRFLGEFSRSPNGRFIVAWDEPGSLGFRSGERHKASGSYLLLDASNIVVRGTMERPNCGKVSDIGIFILHNGTFSEDLSGFFHAFSSSGATVMQKEFAANLYSNAISEDGRFAVCQTCNSPKEEDSGIACLFDLEAKRVLAKFRPVAGWASEYRFDSDGRTLHLIYEDGRDHRYAFDGLFLDSEKWEKDRINYLSGYDLLEMAEDQLRKLGDSNTPAYDEVIRLFEQALKKGVSDNTQARIHKSLGEIYHRCSDRSKAIEHFESALRLNPKIGLKRLVKSLRSVS